MRSLLIFPLLSLAVSAQAEDLGSFLHDATAATRASTVLRARGTLLRKGADDPDPKKLILLRSPEGHLLVELGDAAERVLIPATGSHAFRRGSEGSSASRVSIEDALAGSDFALEDLRAFDAARYGSPIIADRNERQVTVSLDPVDSHYALIVISFDRERKAAVKTMYYVETLNNLVKMRRDLGLSRVGGAWVPRSISMEDFKLRTTSELTLEWDEAPNVDAALFAPSTFAAAPALR